MKSGSWTFLGRYAELLRRISWRNPTILQRAGATGIPIAPDLNLHDLNREVQAIQRSVDQLVMDNELHRKTIERLVRWLGA